jgi:hypothetical protein
MKEPADALAPTQQETLEILNREKVYEDELVEKLNAYLLASLPVIKDITEEEKRQLQMGLTTIIRDSKRHGLMFGRLIQYVMEHGDGYY